MNNLTSKPAERALQGLVTSVDRKGKKDGIWTTEFQVRILSGAIFHCTTTEFCWVLSGDKIFAHGLAWLEQRGSMCKYCFKIIETPIVEPSMDPPNIRHCLINCLGKGKITSLANSEKLYDSMVEYTSQHEYYQAEESEALRVSMYLSYASNQFKKAGSEFGPKLIEPLLQIVSEDDARKLLKNWYHLIEYRKLCMLGLTKKEISSSPYNTELLYRKLRSNPYTIPFLSEARCIELCTRLNLEVDPLTIKCGSISRYIYNTCDRYSHMCLPYSKIANKFNYLQECLDCLLDDSDSIASFDVVYDFDQFYLRSNYEDEMLVTFRIGALYEEGRFEGIEEPVYQLSTLTDIQKTAIRGCLNNPVAIITGGGGSGKTTSIKEIVYNWHLLNEMRGTSEDFLVCSFTGKAVENISEILGQPLADITADVAESMKNRCFTIHRSVFKGVEGLIKHVIIDEATMVTVGLLAFLLRNYPDIRSITLVGDCNQLLPIGSGCLFTQVISSGRFPIYRLAQIHRLVFGDTEDNGIYYNSNTLANASSSIYFEFKTFETFQLYEGGLPLLENRIKTLADAGISDHQLTVLCPVIRGTDKVNDFITKIYRPGQFSAVDSVGIGWRIGDRVMMTVNNYNINVMNGSEGRVVGILEGKIAVAFGKEALTWKSSDSIEELPQDRIFNFDLKHPDEKNLAYNKIYTGVLMKSNCMTIHKSQGSEWSIVILYVPEGVRASSSFFNRNMVYTAITRPTTVCLIIGNIQETIKAANTRASTRYEKLAERLERNLPECFEGADNRFVTIGVFEDYEVGYFESEYDITDFM